MDEHGRGERCSWERGCWLTESVQGVDEAAVDDSGADGPLQQSVARSSRAVGLAVLLLGHVVLHRREREGQRKRGSDGWLR